jgi:hypothetical protein
MELKLLAMANVFQNGHLVHCTTHARECRVAAELCRRLREEVWYDMHGVDTQWQCLRIRTSEKTAEEYLGRLIEKHLRTWWD